MAVDPYAFQNHNPSLSINKRLQQSPTSIMTNLKLSQIPKMSPPPNGEIIPTNTVPVSDFPNFDVVSGGDPLDHHYFIATKANAPSPAFHKKVMQEWRVLGNNLPETIFVRVYESRIDLLRAAIVGAPGTPYHDLLFFFDIHLPPDYPSSPPNVLYRSFGFRINPNLYTSGKVCLSLLNTWSGHKSEKWDRNQSTILQVLLSIQALVLNEEPYFNEPGYGGRRGKTFYEKASEEYSESAFADSCKSAIHLLRHPPLNFEVLLNSHFRQRGLTILNAINAYRSGRVRVGAKVPVTGVGVGWSSPFIRFNGLSYSVYGDLVEAFAKTGAPVDQFVIQVENEKKAKALQRKEEEKKKKERERKKAAREALKKKVMAVVEKIRAGLGFKKRSICNYNVPPEVKMVQDFIKSRREQSTL